MAKNCNVITFKTVHFALIPSHLAYGISIYGSKTNMNLDRLLVQQNRIMRTMKRLKTTNTVKHIFAELGILTVYGLFTFETINYVKQFNNARLLKRQKKL